ncbi:MAG TPA: glycoside hydrolase family 2 TIM barrel-domain containing protein, partial [Chthoniobacterales bacterium]|nr:glycoside hydrolase family 2 TIM barrel-domain containing protein [Chthoniobacterales bacterium]
GNDNYFSTRVYRNPLEVTQFNYRRAARYEVGWYRRTIRIPQNDHWHDRRVILHVGAADFFTDAWCNGAELGSHEGGFSPFEFDLTQHLVRAADGHLEGTIVLRVEDPMNNHDQPVGKQWGWYSSASGIWQTVFVEPRAEQFIERFEVTTDIDRGLAHFKVFVSGGSAVASEITSPQGEIFTSEAKVANGIARVAADVSPPILWDPNAPHLYRVKLTLRNGATPDVLHSYFGMRSLAAVPVDESGAPGTLNLNGEPIYLRGALYQSYHPEGIYTAGGVEAIQDDILQAKRAGFDLLRIHIKVDDPLVLHYADTLGVLLMADFPNFGEGGDTEAGRRRYEEMMRSTIGRDFNHPSIVAWCLFNETWGFGGQTEFVKLINPTEAGVEAPVSSELVAKKLNNEAAHDWVQSMWQLAKALDPTRLVEDMSVVAWDHLEYYGHGDTDVNSWHFYTNDYEKARRGIEEIVEKTYTGSSHNYVPGFHQRGQPLINSEYGGVGALDGDVDTSWSFKFLTNELRRHGKLSAYIYTELHDVEWERNGFLNYDRTPKEFGYDPTVVNQGDVLPIDAPPISRRTPGEEVKVAVFSSHFSRRKREEVSLHWRLEGIDSLGWVHADLGSGSAAIGFPHLRVELARNLDLRMPLHNMLCTFWVRAFVADGTLVARNYIHFLIDAGAVARETIDGRAIFRLEPHEWHAGEWNRSATTREQAKNLGACQGASRGYFEWRFPLGPAELRDVTRLTVLIEASAFRDGAPQTDSFAQPTAFRMRLNGVVIYRTILPNHPHDSRGALSYLRGGRGAYGYLTHTTVEGALLEEVKAAMKGNRVCLRCAVPRYENPQGGLTIYGSRCGRYPIGPTLIVETR